MIRKKKQNCIDLLIRPQQIPSEETAQCEYSLRAAHPRAPNAMHPARPVHRVRKHLLRRCHIPLRMRHRVCPRGPGIWPENYVLK